MGAPASDRADWPGRLLALLAGAYFVAVAVWNFGPDVHASADAVGDGRVWLLITSALDVAGELPALQLTAGVALAAWVIARAGARLWWLAAVAGHVGSALLAYALIGLATALGSASADRASDDPDYGVSCVIAGSLGALLATGLAALRHETALAREPALTPETASDVDSRRQRRAYITAKNETALGVDGEHQTQSRSVGGDWAAVAVGFAGLVAMVPFSIGWYAVEHLLAFGIAAGGAWLALRPRKRVASSSRTMF